MMDNRSSSKERFVILFLIFLLAAFSKFDYKKEVSPWGAL